MSALGELFELPESVHQTDFVHEIRDGGDADHTRKTLRQYRVTPSIETRLTSALGKAADGLRDKKSVFTWIHGSFGSGKSHFMNVLSLLLADDNAVYVEHPELQAQQLKFKPAVIGRKLFRVHIQCIARTATSLEEIIFGAATEQLARQHPGHPAPALFEVTRVFASAVELLKSLGDEKFFAEFPSNKADATATGWGKLKKPWDRERFDNARQTPDSDEGRKLAGELARTPWLKDVVVGAAYVRLNEGLRALAEHLKGLGYEGVVLFLDELVLWLTTLQGDKKLLSSETAKVAALVEHGNPAPVLPFLTFAARQRDLSKMVGSFAVGKDEEVFRDYLKYWDSRFETIELEDKDLPRIIEGRILRAKSEAAREQVDQAFNDYRERYKKDFRDLFGDQGDAEDFRRVYPFSPALVETMVALSSTLQRERTALRELTNLLVHYLPDFQMGSVVPVGDLFDVVVHGQASDISSIQHVYEQARQTWENDLLPHIRKKNKTDDAVRCQLLRESFDKARGCSGCAEKSCRTQTRIAKTVLLQGIAPNASALKNLTAQKIVALNSGTLTSKVPSQEYTVAANYLRDWGTNFPAIRVEGEGNPTVRAALDSIDAKRIIETNGGLDNMQRRRVRVRDMIFAKLGVKQTKTGWRRTVNWCARDWEIGVVYENVRSATEQTFRTGADEDLRLIIDFPFDEVGYNPADDEKKLLDVAEAGRQHTIAWLPAFVSEDIQTTLRELVVLDGLVDLKDDDFAQRVSWISAEDLNTARETLRGQRSLKERKVSDALEAAYSIVKSSGEHLAPGLKPSKPLHLLVADAPLTMPTAGAFDRCLEGFVEQALQRIAPRHPAFKLEPTRSRLEHVLESLAEVVQSEGKKKRLDPARLKNVEGIAAVNHMGLVRVVDDEVVFAGGLLNEVSKRLASKSGVVSAGDVRAALDPENLMMLSRELQDFLILTWAVAAETPCRFTLHGTPIELTVGKVDDAVALIPVKLPTPTVWAKALEHGEVLGVKLTGKVVSAPRLDEFASQIQARAQAFDKAGLTTLAQELTSWGALLGVDDIEQQQRGQVIRQLRDFVTTVTGQPAFQVAELTANLPWKKERFTALTYMTEPRAIQGLKDLLQKENNRELISTGREQGDAGSVDAKQVLDALRAALTHDENVSPFAKAMDTATGKLIKLLKPVAPPPAPISSPPSAPTAPLPPASVGPGPTVSTPGPVVAVGGSSSNFTATAAHEAASTTTSEHHALRAVADVEALAVHLRQLIKDGVELEVVVTARGQR
jgi:hypothetical protein